jgi:hypothetical protein
VSSLYQNLIIGELVRAFEDKRLVLGNTVKDNGKTTFTIVFEEKKEEN